MNNLKKAQEIMFDTLVDIDRICQKYHINYWLSSGTLLGAVRHNSFIPWDDDLDICMIKEDYDQFLQIAQKELPNNMFLQTKKTDKGFPYDIAKIRNNKGIIIEKHEANKNVKYNQGIFIDIFPMILVSNSKLLRFYQKVHFLFVKLFTYKYLNIECISIYLVNLFYKFHNKDNNILINSAALPDPNIYIDKSYIFPLEKIEFHNQEFLAPNNSDKYLKTIYGDDYMTPPPEDKQHSHAFRIDIYE